MRLFRKLTAVLCAVIMFSCSSLTAKADDELIRLPSGKNLDEFITEIEEKNTMNDEDEPSFASAEIGVFRGDEILYTGYFGQTDIKNHIPADENSVYEWGSISKTFVWVSAMQLWEKGLLDLDKDIREYLPDDFFQHLSYDEPITMMNLMNHNAGWQETTRPIEVKNENEVLPLKEALQAIEPVQINPPNKVMAYSNYGAAVAGYVIECVSGMDYCEYVHKNILEPLGMEHTSINPTHSDNDFVYQQRKLSRSYKTGFQTIDLGNRLHYISAYPAGAAAGTLSDLITYAQAFVNDDAPLFENPETQKFMFEGTSFYGESDIPICCHGFWCDEYTVRTYGHNGATNAGQANMMFDLDSKTGLVVLVNEPNGNIFMEDPQYMVFGELTPEKYNFGKNEKISLSGYYLPSRAVYSGMMKFMPYLMAVPADVIGENINDTGSNVLQAIHDGHFQKYDTAMILGNKTSDGTALQISSEEYIKDKFYVLKLFLLVLYFIIAIVSIYMIRIRHKLKKFGKWQKYSGSATVFSGQAAQISSVIIFLVSFTFFSDYSGIPISAERITGILQIICMAVMIISAVCAVVSMMSKKKKLPSPYYIISAAGSIISVITIIYFEMYRFEIA